MIDVLARQIACFTGRKTVSSLYAAFGTLESFRAHWDTRDVFAIQLIGRKRWIVYEPSFDSPLHMHQSKDVEHEYPCPKTPYLDFILEAGDIFYLPRGWWHNPMPLGEETLHLAVGTFPAYAIDYIKWVFYQAPSLIEARASLNNWHQDESILIDLASKIEKIIKNENNYQRFISEFISKSRVDTPLAIEKLGNASLKTLPDNTVLRIGSNGLHGTPSNYIIVNGQKLNLCSESARLISVIATRAPINLSQIKKTLRDINPKKLQKLIYDLCREDILELVRT